MMTLENKHFEFKDWKEAFKSYYSAIEEHGLNKVQFVCSIHDLTSGYWIGRAGTPISSYDNVIPHCHVAAYKNAIEKEIKESEMNGKSPSFILFKAPDQEAGSNEVS